MVNPVSGQVLVDPIEENSETDSGILLNAKKDVPLHRIGTVLAFNKSDTPAFTVGDKILYLLAESSKITHENKKLTLVPTHAILAVVED